MLSSTTARSEGFISNGVYAVLFYRSLLGGGFDLSNDVLSSTIPGTDGLGTCFSKHLTSQWFEMESSMNHPPVLPTDFEPRRGMDRYLDSLFDPVLSDGIEVCYIINCSNTLGQIG